MRIRDVMFSFPHLGKSPTLLQDVNINKQSLIHVTLTDLKHLFLLNKNVAIHFTAQRQPAKVGQALLSLGTCLPCLS